MIAQDPFLFSATVRENIAFGRVDATDEEIERAARLAQAHEFVEALPEGYDTVIGERGITLSGGQRQRVAIARALVVDPRILILDDATASVDATTESRIRVGLREAMRGRTTIIIAHRLSTIALADEIVVLDGGRIVCHGTHAGGRARIDVYREIEEHGLLERDLRRRTSPNESASARIAPDARRPAAGRRLVLGADEAPARDALPPRAAVPRHRRCSRSSRSSARRSVALAPPYLVGRAIDDVQARGHGRPRRSLVVAFVVAGGLAHRVHVRRRRTSPAGQASACSPTFATTSSATCSASRSASTSATARA